MIITLKIFITKPRKGENTKEE